MDANLSLCANASGDSNTISELWLVEESYKTSAQVVASFLLLILVVGLPWNLLVVGIILKKKLYTQPTIILLLNLAFTDIFLLILRTASQVWVGFNGEYNYGDTDSTRCTVCQLGTLITVFPITELYTISYMSFDRFMFIYKPLKYERIVTRFRTLLVLCLTWIIIALISAIIPAIGFRSIQFDQYLLTCSIDPHNNYHFAALLLPIALFPLVLTLVCNIWLLCIVQKNIKAIYSVKRSSSSAASNQEEDKINKVIKKKRHQKQLHLMWVFGALLCCNLATWLPIIFRSIIRISVKLEVLSGRPEFYTASMVLFTFQTLLHPIVETALIKEVQEPQKMIILHFCAKLRSKLSFNITSPSPELRHGCCGCCGDDAQSPGCSGCGLLDICNAAVSMNHPDQSPKSDNTV